jgi:tRNA G18 (ribose-2'-O)-methylase SpoU
MTTAKGAIEAYQEMERRLKKRNIGSRELLEMVNAYGNALADAYYNKGMNDVWEFIDRLEHAITNSIRLEVFGYSHLDDILDHYTPQEALAKLKAYEDSKIEVGDVVTYAGEKGMVLDSIPNKFVVLTYDGWVQEWNWCDVEKTDKHINLDSILEQIGE